MAFNGELSLCCHRASPPVPCCGWRTATGVGVSASPVLPVFGVMSDRGKVERDRQRTTYSDLSGHVLPAHGPFASVCYQAGPGRPFLSAAAASARRGDSREAHVAMKAATVCSVELGQDRSDLATVFGPTNVAIHQVAIAIELGDAQGAIRHIPAVRFDQMPKQLTERRARFLIDVARSFAHVRDDAAAIGALLQAETIAPDELRHHRLTHELVPQLLARESRTSDLRALATRCNLLD